MANPDAQSSVEAVLKQTLELPRAEQRRIADVLAALAVPPHADPTGSSDGLVDEPETQNVHQWLQEIAALPAFEQLRLLDDALQQTAAGEDTDAMQRARKSLLDDNAPLAVRLSVTRIVEEHPAMVAMGVLGLCFGIVALGRGFFRLIF